GGGDSSAPPPAPPGQTATVSVTIVDTLGRFVVGAAVASGGTSANSDASGVATLAVATGGERVLAVTKAGFAEQFKVIDLPAASTSPVSIQAMLIARAAAQTINAIEAGGSATGALGVKVSFPANALVDAAGQPVSGAIQMSMTPVDVSQIDVGAFPGLFEGIPSGAARQPIVSVGTSELVPEQGGQKLQLGAGKTADIELPLFVTKRQDGGTMAAGDVVPLWSLDTASGLWKQEGTGTVILSAASPTGLALHATISHFSWWNGDFAAQQAVVNLTVNVSGTTLPANSVADVSGVVLSGSGPSSTATATVGVGGAGIALKVPASSVVTRLSARFETGSQTCTGFVDVSPATGSSVSATITMSCVLLDVRLVRPATDLATNSASPLPFLIEVDGQAPDSVELFADATSVAQFSAQFFYPGLWDSSSFPEGTVQLHARASRAGMTQDSGVVRVVIDRTPPRATSFAPDVAVTVDRNTVFTVHFNEPVGAAPLLLSDAIRLTVTPPGSTTPVPIAFNASLDVAGVTLTVTPAAVLPIGIAGLSWAGLHDPAGNAVTGTIAATWDVSRATQLGGDFEFIGNGTRMAFAVNSAGVVHAAFQRKDDLSVQVRRFDGSDFVPLGPQVNQRAFGTELAMAIDANGAPLVALEQLNVAGDEGEVVVRRYDAINDAWLSIGPPLPIGRPIGFGGTARPRLAIDAANRPVLTFVAGGGVFTLQAYRFDGNAWNLLGNIADLVFSEHDLVLDAVGNPFVAYLQGFAGSNAESLRVAAFNGTAFVTLGQLDATADATDAIVSPRIALAPDGKPSVAWGKRSLGGIRLAAFDGTAFADMPIVPALPSFNLAAALTFVAGDPVVAGGQVGGVDVRRFHAGAWEPPSGFTTARAGSLVMIPGNNSVLIGETTAASGQAFGHVTRFAFP
ncbi:MAG: Ig-like domain-containing protein, partial [Caldimonas sp.]